MTRASAARPLLWPLVPVFRLGLALREFQLRSGLKLVRQLKWPVVSIGNLSTGGAGKTPLSIALAKALTVRGLHVDVLSRGYGRISHLPALVDPDGTILDVGDEPLLIARETGIPVYVAAERYQAGLLAEAQHSASQQPGLHLLDDGFQHRQLARDVDILILSQRDLTDALLPAGNLREPISAARRAAVIAIPADEPEIEAEIRSQGWRVEVWRLHRRMEIPVLEDSGGGPVAAFCGIARPGQFFEGLESAGLRLAARIAFPDHHGYTAGDINRIATTAHDAGAQVLLTTEKDHVRMGALASALPASLPLQTVGLHVKVEDEDGAVDWLIRQLEGKVKGQNHRISTADFRHG